MTVDFSKQANFFKKNKITQDTDAVKKLLNHILSHAMLENDDNAGPNDAIIRLVTKGCDFESRAIDMIPTVNRMEELVAYMAAGGKEEPKEIPGPKDMWVLGSTSAVDPTINFIRLFEHPNPVDLITSVREDMNDRTHFTQSSTLVFCHWSEIIKSMTH